MKDEIPRKTFLLLFVGIVSFFLNLLMTLFSQQIFELLFGIETHYAFIGVLIFSLYITVFGATVIVTLAINSKEFLNKRRGVTRFVPYEKRCAYLQKLISLNRLTMLISVVLMATLLIFWDNMDFPVFIVGEWLWAVVLLMCRQKIIDYKEEISNA